MRKRRPEEGVRCEPGRRTKVNRPMTRREALPMSKPRMRVASGRAWGRPVVLPRRHPAYRRREPGSGANVERVKLRTDRAGVVVAVEVDG